MKYIILFCATYTLYTAGISERNSMLPMLTNGSLAQRYVRTYGVIYFHLSDNPPEFIVAWISAHVDPCFVPCTLSRLTHSKIYSYKSSNCWSYRRSLFWQCVRDFHHRDVHFCTWPRRIKMLSDPPLSRGGTSMACLLSLDGQVRTTPTHLNTVTIL